MIRKCASQAIPFQKLPLHGHGICSHAPLGCLCATSCANVSFHVLIQIVCLQVLNALFRATDESSWAGSEARHGSPARFRFFALRGCQCCATSPFFPFFRNVPLSRFAFFKPGHLSSAPVPFKAAKARFILQTCQRSCSESLATQE